MSSRPTSRPAHSPLPRPPQVNSQTTVLDAAHGKILCIADIRGRLSALNDMAREAGACAIIHTGDFGFFEETSLERINDRTLRHLTMYSPLIPSAQRTHLLSPENTAAAVRLTVSISLLSEFPLLLSGQIKLQVPVYTVWGACEDLLVLERFRSGAYSIDNLHIIDEATTRCLDVGGVKLRLLGLGGALVMHKMFDNGDGRATIAGGQGTMWTTALQIGELVDTAQRVFDQTETRLLVSHASPGREGILAQLALVLKADLTISAGLHFRYATSYNEFSVQGDFDGFRQKLLSGKEGFDKVWESVKGQVDAVIDDNQRVLLDKALSVVSRVPPPQTQAASGLITGEEPAWKNCWNWNLCDAAYGSLLLDIREGRISSELRSQGFNYAYRRTATVPPTPGSAASPLPNSTSNNHVKAGTPKLQEVEVSTPANGMSLSPKSEPEAKQHEEGTSLTAAPFKADRDKQKKKDKKERKDRERDQQRNGESKDLAEDRTPSSGKVTPSIHDPPASTTEGVSASRKPSDGGDEARSPVADSPISGARTPTSKRPQRNPWTLFMRMTVPANEAELREYYGEAASGIIRINYPQSFAGRNQKMAYVEFGDEESMKAGLEKRAEKLKDTTPEVVQATDRESRQADGQHRGGPRGRGRGGFAARGFAAAGLTKPSHAKNESSGTSPAAA